VSSSDVPSGSWPATRASTSSWSTRGLLTSTPEGATDYIDADGRDPDRILAEAARTLDFNRPVGIVLLGIMSFVVDDEQAARS
jgi:hypothetical protein